ncbi:MAG: SRPBCC family protein [Desulfobacterales bacterium]|nr:SRPBCC family protein [Desulfobacterales bacterium]
MKIKESTIVNCSVDDIWDILKDPGNMPAWNPKCHTCDAGKTISIGSSFDATFRLGSKEKKTSCRIMDLKPGEKITIRYSGEAFSTGDGFVDETFTLVYQGVRQTKLVLEVDFSQSELPFLIKSIMWFLSRFGQKSGKSSLDGIRSILE